jgi:hypothetical protein
MNLTSIRPSSRLSSSQLTFDLNLRNCPPLAPLAAAMWILQRDEDSVLELIENGLLLWAFDISNPNARTRSEIRIFRDSLRDYLEGKSRMGRPCADAPVLDYVIKHCLPGDKPFIAASLIARNWTCSRTHINQLIDASALVQTRSATRGPNGSAIVTRASAEQFLTARCESISRSKNQVMEMTGGTSV